MFPYAANVQVWGEHIPGRWLDTVHPVSANQDCCQGVRRWRHANQALRVVRTLTASHQAECLSPVLRYLSVHHERWCHLRLLRIQVCCYPVHRALATTRPAFSRSHRLSKLLNVDVSPDAFEPLEHSYARWLRWAVLPGEVRASPHARLLCLPHGAARAAAKSDKNRQACLHVQRPSQAPSLYQAVRSLMSLVDLISSPVDHPLLSALLLIMVRTRKQNAHVTARHAFVAVCAPAGPRAGLAR
eukprot:366301-Chlamydomonas_euryale.AAC.9